jgi:hypothetical protein
VCVWVGRGRGGGGVCVEADRQEGARNHDADSGGLSQDCADSADGLTDELNQDAHSHEDGKLLGVGLVPGDEVEEHAVQEADDGLHSKEDGES